MPKGRSKPILPKVSVSASNTAPVQRVGRGRKPKKTLTQADLNEIQRLYQEERLSIRAVVAATGFSLWQVRQTIGESRTLAEAAPRVEVAPVLRQQILTLRCRGLTYDEIAAESKQLKGRVARVVQEGLDDATQAAVVHQISQRPRYDYNRIVELSNEGYTKAQIADILGCSFSTVAKARRLAKWNRT